jgi:hypothetical protein
MKPIVIEVDERPQSGEVDKQGDFVFYLYASNECGQEFEEAIETLIHLWDLQTEVSIKINLRLKDVYNDLYEMFNAGGKIQQVDTPRFEALRKDCQWIIDRINELEMNT